MTRRNVIALLTVLFAFLFIVVGSAVVSQAAKAPETIKIVGVISMTGGMAAQGVQASQAYQIYFDKINANGGVFVKAYNKKIPIEFRILDDESDGQKTQNQLEVANSWGAIANVGGFGCSSFEMGTPIAQKNKMTWVGPGCGGWTPHLQGNDYLFSTFHKTPYFSPLVFDMIKAMPEPRPKRVAIFEINQLDCAESVEAWTKKAKEVGAEIVFHQKYPLGNKDFSALITGAKAAKADVLLSYPTPPEGITLIKQMKELDFSPKVNYVARAAEGSQFGPTLGELSDYVFLPVGWSNTLKFDENESMVSKFKEKYNVVCDPGTGVAYASAQVLVNAIERAGSLDRKAVRDAVKATDMETVAGHIKFRDNGSAVDKLMLILQWKNNQRNVVFMSPDGKKYGDKIPVVAPEYQPAWSERK